MTPLATCEVTTYGGQFTGARANLVSFRTTRNGRRTTRLQWRSSAASAHDIHGTFTSVEAAVARAQRDPDVRNVQAD